MLEEGGEIKSELKNFDLSNLDMMEQMNYEEFSKSMPKEDALQIIINTVEGDYSQLSPKLAELAEKQHPMEYAKGGGVNSKKSSWADLLPFLNL